MDENALKKAIERYHEHSILLEKQGGPSAVHGGYSRVVRAAANG